MTEADTLGPKIADALAQWPRQQRIAFPDLRAWSANELRHASGQLSAALLSLGVAAGDRVMVQAHKSAEALALFIAVAGVGAVLVPLHMDATIGDVEALMDDAQPSTLVAPQTTLVGLARKLRRSRVRTALTLEEDGSGTLRELASTQQAARTPVPSRPSDPVLIVYERERAVPGGVVFSQSALWRQGDIAASLLALAETDVVAHGLECWWTPPSLALLLAVFRAGPRLAWHTSASLEADTSGAATVAILERPQAHLVQHARLVLAPAEAGAGAATARFLSLPETGIYAVAPAQGPARIAPLLQARAVDGRLAITDACLFSGYWRRAEESRTALPPDGSFQTDIRVTTAPDGTLELASQP